MTPRKILVVEDGTEYVDAFRRLAPQGAEVEWLHAPDAATARRLLAEHDVEAIFLDVVFDRTPSGGAGRGSARLWSRASRATASAPSSTSRATRVSTSPRPSRPAIPPGARVLLAYDFSSDPARLEALRETLPGLEGVEEGTSASRLVRRLRGES